MNTTRPTLLRSPQEIIRLLQDELEQTNREVMLLTVELEKRVEQRTAELRAAQQQLQSKNSELVKQSAQLAATNKELEAFGYSVSHDLRAPLRHIKGYLDAVHDEAARLSEDARQCLGGISNAADRMAKLIEDLLEFSRNSRAEMRRIQFDMGGLVRQVIAEMARDTQGRNIEWDIQPLPRVTGDCPLLKQVWVNLLSNAVKYTRPRDPAKISVTCAEKSGEWEFCVRDNGVGFDMRYSERLFGVFQRLHDPNEFEGTGIGLANVRRIISRHGGRCWGEGKVGEGAAIYFTLPLPANEAERA
jgi:light-regulated signal transduction histidine kinase (bacteriophytochrome)